MVNLSLLSQFKLLNHLKMSPHKTEWPKVNSTALLVSALNEALLKLEKCEAPPQPCPAQFGALAIAQTLLAIVVFIVTL